MSKSNICNKLSTVESHGHLTANNSNPAMESMYSLQESHLRIIYLALTKIDTKKNEFGENTFTTEEFSEYYGLNVKECDRYIKDAINEIHRSPIRLEYLDDKNREREVTFHWFSSTSVPLASTGGKYTFRFSESVKPYISNLTNTYSKNELKHLTELKIAFNPALIKE